MDQNYDFVYELISNLLLILHNISTVFCVTSKGNIWVCMIYVRFITSNIRIYTKCFSVSGILFNRFIAGGGSD